MPKESIRDRLEGNELDLSLSDLKVVPVKELAAIPKATHLDLSCNLLTSIPDDFCRLTHVVHLDLSKNALTHLPEHIGSLQQLQYLDLFSNKLQTLPVGMCYLKNLKWLDLKENPLQESLKNTAGDCLDDLQCKKCAKNIVAFMKMVESEQERQKQNKLQEERVLKAAKKVEEEKEKEKKKLEKKAEKERRRREYEATHEQSPKLRKEMLEEENTEPLEETEEKPQNGVKTKPDIKQKEKAGLSCCGVLMAIFIGVVAVLVGLYFYCDTYNYKDAFCREGRSEVLKYYAEAQQLLKQYTDKK